MSILDGYTSKEIWSLISGWRVDRIGYDWLRSKISSDHFNLIVDHTITQHVRVISSSEGDVLVLALPTRCPGQLPFDGIAAGSE